MKRTIDEHAARFDTVAAGYDDATSPTYRACLDRVVERADPGPDDIVLDLGTGTGAIALRLAGRAAQVIGRDISESMLAKARENAARQGIDNVSFDVGRFREPRYDGRVDIITSNYALHHLDDEQKRVAFRRMADLGADRIVIGDLMFFEQPDPEFPGFDPSVDDPARVGVLVMAMTEAGFAVASLDRIDSHVGVIVGERTDGS